MMIIPYRAGSVDQIQRTKKIENQRTEYSTIRSNNSESEQNHTSEFNFTTQLWHPVFNTHKQQPIYQPKASYTISHLCTYDICLRRFRLRVEDCLKGCMKIRPKSTIPNSLYILFYIPDMKWQHKGLKFHSNNGETGDK